MMPSAASLARYPAFVKHDQLSSTNQFNPDQSTNNLSSNSSASSTSSSSSSFDLPSLINSSFLQSEFQRNLAQFTNQLTMTGQNDQLTNNNSNGTTETTNNLQYSDDQLINSSNKKLSFSIDSLVNGKHSALNNKQQNMAAALFNGINGLNGANLNINSIKKDDITQNLQINAMAAAALVLNRNGNSLQTNLQKLNNRDDLIRNSPPNSRLISPCSSTSSVCSDQKSQINLNQQSNQNTQHHQRTSANNSPNRPASAASQHSITQQQQQTSASQLLLNAQLQNNLSNNNLPLDGNQSSLSNSKNNLINKIKNEERSSPTQQTANQTTNSRLSTSPSSFINNLNSLTNNQSSIKQESQLNSSNLNLTPDAALLEQIQQQRLRQQIQQLQQVNPASLNPDSVLLQHIQQQHLRQLQQQQQNTPLPCASPHLQPNQNSTANQLNQPPNPTTPQQHTTSTGPPNQTSPFNPQNTAAALLNQLRANSLNGSVANPAALNPLNGLNLPNPAASLPGLGQLGLNAASAINSASLNSLNSLIPSLNPAALNSINPLSPPRPHSLADYQSSYYQYLAMTRPNYYPLGNQYLNPFPFIMGMARKPKRVRTAFNPNQLLQLEQAFEKNQYVVGQERKQLASSLQLSETQVKVWFQNRRTKHKRLKTEGEDPSKSPLSDNNDKCFSADEEIDDDDTEIDPDGFNSDELRMQNLINSNFNPFANGFNNLHPHLFAAAAANYQQQANLRASSNTVTNNQSTTGLTQQS